MNISELGNRVSQLDNGILRKGATITGAATVSSTLEVSGATTLSAGLTLTGSAGTAAGAGLLSTGAGAPTVKVHNLGGEIITVIRVDLQGLASKSDEDDVIGLAAGGAAYLTRVTTAVNGLVYKAEMICMELPTASANPALDIDLKSNSSGTAAYDTDGAAYTAIITAGGNWAAQGHATSATGAFPAANDYLYLTDGATHTGNSTFTGGQFMIILHGYAIMT